MAKSKPKGFNIKEIRGLIGSAAVLPLQIVDSFSDATIDNIMLAAVSAMTGEMDSISKFYWSTLAAVKGLTQVNIDPSVSSIEKICAEMVFQPNYVNQIFSTLKAYTINDGEKIKEQLLSALNEQLNNEYKDIVTGLTKKALQIKKMAIDYVLKNAPSIVKFVESTIKVERFLSKEVNDFEKNFDGSLKQLTCAVIGQNECDSLSHYESIFTSDVITADQAFGKFVKQMNAKVNGIFKLTLQQKLSPAQKTAYEMDLQSVAVDFAFASNIAMVAFGSKTAGKIQALGQVTIGLIATMSSIFKMSSVMKDIGKLAEKIMPALAIVSAVFQVFSIFSGGESASEETQEMIQKYMQILEKQLHII